MASEPQPSVYRPETAILELGGDFYDTVQPAEFPQAILRFRQGFGRLIRSRADRGVVAVLDRRLQSKRYGRAFLESLPDCTVRLGPAADLPAQAEVWLAR